jgi:hypothetical protein
MHYQANKQFFSRDCYLRQHATVKIENICGSENYIVFWNVQKAPKQG